jgi:hypothetical protein
MAAGLGFKTFTTGEVLTAADVNGYLMQGVLVFATEAARNSAITSPQEGQFAFTKDTNSLWYYSGSAWVSAVGSSGSMTEITSGSLPTGASTVTLSAIPGGYRDLRLVTKNARTGSDGDNIALRLNGNTGSVYYDNLFVGEGTTNQAPSTLMRFIGSVDNTANNGLAVATFYEYESTVWKMTTSFFITPNETTPANARGQAYQGGSDITSAITSITIYSTGASNFAAGTYVLYGVK